MDHFHSICLLNGWIISLIDPKIFKVSEYIFLLRLNSQNALVI